MRRADRAISDISNNFQEEVDYIQAVRHVEKRMSVAPRFTKNKSAASQGESALSEASVTCDPVRLDVPVEAASQHTITSSASSNRVFSVPSHPAPSRPLLLKGTLLDKSVHDWLSKKSCVLL